jgi:hypothetical protein
MSNRNRVNRDSMTGRARWWRAALVCVVMASVPTGLARGQTVRPDTVDVAVGSPVVEAQPARPYASRFRAVEIAGHDSTLLFAMTNEVSHFDSGGVPLVRVVAAGKEADGSGALKPAHGAFLLNRLTLAFYAATGDGAPPASAYPASPAFYGPAADIPVEFLPRRLGVVYRLRLWLPGVAAAETHLYQTVGRERVEAFGRQYDSAWVVEDRRAGSGELASRMWLIGEPPYMVRWVLLNAPTAGARVEVSQELVRTRR